MHIEKPCGWMIYPSDNFYSGNVFFLICEVDEYNSVAIGGSVFLIYKNGEKTCYYQLL